MLCTVLVPYSFRGNWEKHVTLMDNYCDYGYDYDYDGYDGCSHPATSITIVVYTWDYC